MRKAVVLTVKRRRAMKIPKINSNGYGGLWIGASLLVGAVAPFVLWLIFRRVFWVLVILGGIGLLAFLILFAIEMHQDSAKVPYYERDMRDKVAYDPQTQYAVIRSSICTGEKVAGFKNKKNGHFTDVMVIRTPADEERFKKIYGLDTVKTEY